MVNFDKYRNFLENPETYYENVELYKKLISKTTDEKISEWVITKYANGSDIMNGNPIYALFIEKKQLAIRIIQHKATIHNPIFTAWINKDPFEMKGVSELVISMQLGQDTYEDCSYLIEIFINKSISPLILKFLNKKYHKLWNENILTYAIKSKKRNKKLEEILNSNFIEDQISSGKLANYGKKFPALFPIYLIDYKFSNNDLNIHIKELKNVTENLYVTISKAAASKTAINQHLTLNNIFLLK